ncbi:phosphatase PAP2 family protein [Limoniibacter endophyticus]|uniref:Inositolphosphotransferase Aur1/Ipt1 domain-containing protein n=1 Tax=Limoniibacter endophyticus TaxID=1565040 RepID=A0A8J3DMZ3_9HYPH|nr:phosphatase PAP2 family protein [Limoniibacter endophyticus]GHC65929.1 hypothetical protein GCM10010136_08990 [Limoniibacter endophyticus]
MSFLISYEIGLTPLYDMLSFIYSILLYTGIMFPLGLAVAVTGRKLFSLGDRFSISRVLLARGARNIFRSLPLWISYAIFMGAFVGIKKALPFLHDEQFPFDRWLADVDRFLFGIDPWELAHALLPASIFLNALELNYYFVWFATMFACIFYFGSSATPRDLRQRFYLVSCVTWIICGNFLAGLLLSAGPIFYGEVTGDNARFAEMLGLVAGEAGGYSTLAIKNYLWDLHVSGASGLGNGISAFPSLHVGISTVNWLFIREVFPRLGIIVGINVLVIWFSSVYLGWHYAIDGIVSIGFALAIYWFARYFSARHVRYAGKEV